MATPMDEIDGILHKKIRTLERENDFYKNAPPEENI